MKIKEEKERENPQELEEIKINISDMWGVDISSKSRKLKAVLARTLFCYICRKKGEYSFAQIGRVIKRDHATVMHAIKRFDKIEQYPEFKTVINRSLNLYELPLKFGSVSENYEGLRHSILQLQNRIKKLSKGVDPIFIELNALPEDKLFEFKEYRAKPFLKMNKAV